MAQCTCCSRLHMQRLEEGRYRLGNRIYYLRRFRNHVMVRVGGGWVTLDEFLNRHDPCRRVTGRKLVNSNLVKTDFVPVSNSSHLLNNVTNPKSFSSNSACTNPAISYFKSGKLPHTQSTIEINHEQHSNCNSCSMGKDDSYHCNEFVSCSKSVLTDQLNLKDSICSKSNSTFVVPTTSCSNINSPTNTTTSTTNNNKFYKHQKSLIPRNFKNPIYVDEYRKFKVFCPQKLKSQNQSGLINNISLKNDLDFPNPISLSYPSSNTSSITSTSHSSISLGSKLSGRFRSIERLTTEKQPRWKM